MYPPNSISTATIAIRHPAKIVKPNSSQGENRASPFPFTLYPFPLSLPYRGVFGTVTLHKSTFNLLKNTRDKGDQMLHTQTIDLLPESQSKEKDRFTLYRFPFTLSFASSLANHHSRSI